MNNAIATFTEVLDMGSTTYDSLERRSREAHVGSQTADTIKLNFRFRCASRCSRRKEKSAGDCEYLRSSPGWVVKSLTPIGGGPVGLLHTKKVGIKWRDL